jgi:predicted Zn-ribbon and HTH transcriptional regulator
MLLKIILRGKIQMLRYFANIEGSIVNDFKNWCDYIIKHSERWCNHGSCRNCGEKFPQNPDIPLGECPNCESNNIIIKESI